MEIGEHPVRRQVFQNSSPRLSIFSARDDYRMNDPARKAALLALSIGEEQ
jgi:hypothetical protein